MKLYKHPMKSPAYELCFWYKMNFENSDEHFGEICFIGKRDLAAAKSFIELNGPPDYEGMKLRLKTYWKNDFWREWNYPVHAFLEHLHRWTVIVKQQERVGYLCAICGKAHQLEEVCPKWKEEAARVEMRDVPEMIQGLVKQWGEVKEND
jgi:hypothetical protein